MRSKTCIFALFLLVIVLSGCTAELTSETVAPLTMPPAPETARPPAVEETQPPTVTTAAPETTVVDAEALFMEKCSVCHSYIHATIKKKTREQWQSTVNRMVTTNGGRTRAGITDEDAAMIVDYLVENYSLS